MRHVGIGAPDDDQVAEREVGGVSRRHRSVRAIPRLPHHRCTDRDVGAGRTELLPHQRRQPCTAEVAGGRAVEVRHHGRPAVLARSTLDPVGGNSSSASSHVISTNSPEPFGPTRRSGEVMRSTPCSSCGVCLTFAQIQPSVLGSGRRERRPGPRACRRPPWPRGCNCPGNRACMP